MNFSLTPTQIPEVLIVETKKFFDERGLFMETYQVDDFAKLGIKDVFFQDNLSVSKKGVLRGLHYQLPPFAQAKLVRVLKGEIWDVAVDLRKNSSTYKQSVGVNLTEANGQALYIPAGFAHGFVALSEETVVAYKASAPYNKAAERGINWNSEGLKISWPVASPILSAKDAAYPDLDLNEVFS